MKYEVAIEQIKTKFLRIRKLELNQEQYESMKAKVGKEINGFRLVRITTVID